MDKDSFRAWSHRASDWAADYYASLPDRPVRAQVDPGDIGALIGDVPPERAVEMDTVFADFERIVPGGMTHWQHPRFFACFQRHQRRRQNLPYPDIARRQHRHSLRRRSI